MTWPKCWEDRRIWLSTNESLPHGNVANPIIKLSRQRILSLTHGDVDEDTVTDVECACVSTVELLQTYIGFRNR